MQIKTTSVVVYNNYIIIYITPEKLRMYNNKDDK